jgi:hypothetical protein
VKFIGVKEGKQQQNNIDYNQYGEELLEKYVVDVFERFRSLAGRL